MHGVYVDKNDDRSSAKITWNGKPDINSNNVNLVINYSTTNKMAGTMIQTVSLRINGTVIWSEKISFNLNVPYTKTLYATVPLNSDGTGSFIMQASYVGGSGATTTFKLRISNGRIKIDNIWKNAFAWIKTLIGWKRCLIWRKINGIWKRGK